MPRSSTHDPVPPRGLIVGAKDIWRISVNRDDSGTISSTPKASTAMFDMRGASRNSNPFPAVLPYNLAI